MNESSSDEEEINVDIVTSQSNVAAQKQQNDGGSTVQGDNLTDRDEARIFELTSKRLKNIAIFFISCILLFN